MITIGDCIKANEEHKDREIGEVFFCKGAKVEVVEATKDCNGCLFDSKIYVCPPDTGNCGHNTREDNKDVIFIITSKE